MTAIRDEGPHDADAVRRVNDEAFGQPDEGRLVDALRARGAISLSLVAVIDGTVVGHLLMSPATIADVRGAALGPMAVAPSHQRRGIGSQLVQTAVERLREGRCPFVVVLGHPGFYPRFGFTPARPAGVTCDWDVPDDVFMMAVLDPSIAGRLHGRAEYQPEFAAFE